MKYLILGQVLLFAGFIGTIWAVYGIQPSISDSWYALKKTKKEPLFTVWLVMVGFSIIGIFVFTVNSFYFFSGACLCFTGVAAEFKQKMTSTVHVLGAVGGIGLGFTGQISTGMWIPAAIYVVGVILIDSIRSVTNKTWWIENLAFICLEVGFISMIK